MTSVTPIAARLGFTHVAVAQSSSGRWAVVLWSKSDGPTMLQGSGDYQGAIEQAKGYATKRPNVVLDLAADMRSIDVLRTQQGGFDILQMSAGEGSGAILRSFGPHEREGAVRYALDMVPQYSPCKLGRVDA